MDGLSPRTRAIGAAAKVLGTGALAVLLFLTAQAVFQLRHLEDEAQVQRDGIEQVLGVLIECTTDPAERKTAAVKPGEDDCYVRQQKRLESLVGPLEDLSVIAAACGAANPGNIPSTRQCVEKAITDKETP